MHSYYLCRLLLASLRRRRTEPSIPLHSSSPSWTSRSCYCSTQPARKRPSSLASVIFPLGQPGTTIVPELDKWALEHSGPPRLVDLHGLIRELRKRRRFAQSLEVSEWMKNKGKVVFSPSDHAVHLDLIGEVHGLPSAESYFDNMNEKDRTEKTYGALLNCYVRERLTEKSLSHLQKMKELGLVSSPLPYNDIMSLYANTRQHDKIPSVLAEMKSDGVLPDNFSYRICINSYGHMSDIDGIEKILEEMKHQPQIVMDWNTYTVVANIYIRKGLTDKAVDALKKAEEKIDRKNGTCYNQLISLYSALGDKFEMLRIWECQKVNCKYINQDYSVMLSALLKLDDREKAESLLKEWELSGNSFDFRVPNILFSVYRQNGSPERAEAILDDFLNKGHSPPSSSWGIVAAGYATKGDIKKAYELMLNALCVYTPKTGWEPNSTVVKQCLDYLCDEGDVHAVENFIGLLKNAVPVDRYMYHTLIKAHIRAGRGLDGILKSMKEDGIEQDEKTHEILNSESKVAASSL